MKLNIHDIHEDARRLVYDEPTAALTGRLVHGGICDFEFPGDAKVQLDYYRSGQELFFLGSIEGSVVGHCGRCLETYTFPLSAHFSLVLVPNEALPSQTGLTDDDLDLSYYSGEEIDLTPLIDEQIILALPTRPLCSEECKGLCPSCGKDLNTETCDCPRSAGDPRLAVLRDLKIGH
jgi:uncharacterized protein